MNKIAKGLLRFLAQIALATILLMGGKIVMDGMWLLGLPEQSEIESVSIAYPDVTEEVKEAEKKAEEVEASAAVKPETKTVVSKKKSSGNSRRTYRVKSGDSLYTIARKQGTTVKKLCELNNLSPKSIIRKGQVIRCS